MVDLGLLKEFIRESGLKLQTIADLLRITYQSLWVKLKGQTEFTASEMMALKDVLRLNQSQFMRIFFAKKRE